MFYVSEENNCLPKSNVSKLAKCAQNNLSSLVDQPKKIRQTICFSQTEMDKTENNTSTKADCSVINSGIGFKKKVVNGGKQIDCKSKRPRISINSDDEDDKNTSFIPPVTEKSNEITNVLLKKHNKTSMSQVIVVKKSKVSFYYKWYIIVICHI